MLYVFPIIIVLIGLALYGVLGGADFGVGFWELTAGGGERGDRIREAAHESMAPVWEANHVWLIFVLTVTWTAYPRAFGSLASTLAIPLMIAAIGIIFRGAAYALRSAATGRREQRRIDTGFGVACLIAPFALGAAVGGIASGRVPVGNAAGPLVSSWLNPTSILIGVLAVVTGIYLSVVFLAADSTRRDEPELAEVFRARALIVGLVAGAIAIGGFFVLQSDAPRLFHRLVHLPGLPALGVSVAAGGATLLLLGIRRFELARYCSALAVATIIAGWALAQEPLFLPGLTVRQAAAGHDTEVAVLVAVLGGAILLFPALLTLFRLALGGHLSESQRAGPTSDGSGVAAAALDVAGGSRPAPNTASDGGLAGARPALLARLAGALFLAGIGFTNVADATWAHVIGAACYVACVIVGFRVAVPLAESA